MKRSVLNGSEHKDGCFTTAVFRTQHASFSVRCGGRTAVGGGNGTRKNTTACAYKQQNNRMATGLCVPFQASANVMDLDFKILDSEILIAKVEKKAGTVQLIDWHLSRSPNGPDEPRPYIKGPSCPVFCCQLSGALFLAKVPDGPQT